MRLRKKWWARPELEDSDIVITSPDVCKGKWKDKFKNNNKIYLELGCGMGSFISQSAILNPNINYIGIDLKDEVLVNAKRNVENSALVANTTINNVRLIPFEISFINNVFEKDEIDRIYINFCNPWPKLRHNKRRLTHTTFLNRYKQFLKPNSQIWFKTDNKGLFEDSKLYFEESGFKIKYLTYDLHNSDFTQNIITEYEKKFSSLGMNIMFLIAELG